MGEALKSLDMEESVDFASELLQKERIRVFIPDDFLVWVEAAVIHSTDDGTTLVEVIDEEYIRAGKPSRLTLSIVDLPRPYESFPLQNMDIGNHGVSDMCSLNYLHEPSILDNLFRRFKAEMPYTYTGDICIAVNPYQWLDIYGDEYREKHLEHFRYVK